MNTDDLIEIGFVRAAHGLRGQVVIHAHSREEESLTKYGPLQNADGSKFFELEVISDNGNDFMCSVKGINDRNQAEALRGTKFFVPASALPPTAENEFYIRDLIGLRVQDDKGIVLGKVFNVLNLGAQDALDIEFIHNGTDPLEEPQTEVLLLSADNVPVIKPAEGYIVINLPYGLLDVIEKDA